MFKELEEFLDILGASEEYGASLVDMGRLDMEWVGVAGCSESAGLLDEECHGRDFIEDTEFSIGE